MDAKNAWVDDRIRRLKEKTRNLALEIDDLEAEWFGTATVPGKSAAIENDAKALYAARDGVDGLSGANVTNCMAAFIAIRDAIKASGRYTEIAAGCVRPPRVE